MTLAVKARTVRTRVGAIKRFVRDTADLALLTLAARRFRTLSHRRRCEALPLLRTAWGNLGYSANVPYLAAVLEYAGRTPGPILECGTGLTTLLLALSGDQPVWSLEHLDEWRQRVTTRLRLTRTRANVVCAPLKEYRGFHWYDVSGLMPNEFQLVVCDGPPSTTPGGRIGLLPVLGHRLAHGATILLDDVVRRHEQDVLRRWAASAGWQYVIKGSGQDAYAVVTVRRWTDAL
jgi:hypothetical protein